MDSPTRTTATRAGTDLALTPWEWRRLMELRVPARVLARLRQAVALPLVLVDRHGRERGRFGGQRTAVCQSPGTEAHGDDILCRTCRESSLRRAAVSDETVELSEHDASIRRLVVPIRPSGELVGALVTDCYRRPEGLSLAPHDPAPQDPGAPHVTAAQLAVLRFALECVAGEVALFLESSGRPPACLTSGAQPLLGSSAGIARVLESIEVAASSQSPVLIVGATGTGKELVATAVHSSSTRRGRSLVVVNCAALSETLLESELFGHVRGAFTGAHAARAGLFEEASGGTVFLDEVQCMSPRLQAKLLRVLEAGTLQRLGASRVIQVDVRILAATNEGLLQRVDDGAFRRDLYYRLDVLRIRIPPLRDRAEDIALLAHAFCREACIVHGIPEKPLEPGALAVLAAHPWPGNVRELRHAITRAVLHAPPDRVRAADLDLAPITPDGDAPSVDSPAADPSGLASAEGDRPNLSFTERRKLVSEAWERRVLRAKLAECGGNKSRLAREIGMSRNKLSARLRRLGVV